MNTEYLRRKLEATKVYDKLMQSCLHAPLVQEIYEDSNGDKSICTILTLMTLFGVEKVSVNDSMVYSNDIDFWSTVERLGIESGWGFYRPSSVYDFVTVMEDENTIGAAVATSICVEGKGELAHVMAILGFWLEREEGHKFDRYLILHDTASLSGGLLLEVGFEDLVEIYAESEISDDGGE